jgi:hypothetical protein
MVKESFSWDRFKRFYRRNDTLFYSIGVIVLMHVFWWQIQQNRAYVHPEERRRYLGPFKIIYLDELDFFKRLRQKRIEERSNSDKSNK